MSSTNRLIVGMLVIAGLAVAFWVLALEPERREASKLEGSVSNLKATLATDRQELGAALAARSGFAADYGQLVVLGKAVPADDDTASLLVELNQIANKAGVRFQEIQLGSSGSAASAPAPSSAATQGSGSSSPSSTSSGSSSSSSGSTSGSHASSSASSGSSAGSGSGSSSTSGSSTSSASTASAQMPTEATAATLPLGSTIGPAGLGVMPYMLKFNGRFSHVADFIHGLDKLVKTYNSRLAVDGRLVTINGFSLGSQQGKKFPKLDAIFSVTTYLVPASQGVTAGATPAAPSAITATPTSTKTGGAP